MADEANTKLLNEILDRARRTETRVTKVANHLGVDAGGEKPRWTFGQVDVPSKQCSLAQCLEMIPNNWLKCDPVKVYHQGQLLMVLYLED